MNCEGLKVITDPCIQQNGIPNGFWILILITVLLIIFGGLIGYYLGLRKSKEKVKL